jgi:hypothetical protein
VGTGSSTQFREFALSHQDQSRLLLVKMVGELALCYRDRLIATASAAGD